MDVPVMHQLSEGGDGAAVAVVAPHDASQGFGPAVRATVTEPWVPDVSAPKQPVQPPIVAGSESAREGDDLLALVRAQLVQSLSRLETVHERELVARDAHARSLLVAYNDAVRARDGQIAALQGQLAESRAANATLQALAQDREAIIRLREQEVKSLYARIDDLDGQVQRARQGLAALEAETASLRELLYGPVEPRRRASTLICAPEEDEAARRRR